MLTENLSKRVLKYWHPRESESQLLNRGVHLLNGMAHSVNVP